MNLDKFEKIDGREALKRLVNGETVFNWCGDSYQIEGGLVIEKTGKGNEFCANLTLNGVIGADGWYIPKPFDVRQAMLDRPNEWVGAFEVAEKWYKVGLDTTFMQMACASITSEISVDLSEGRVFEVQLSNLNNCIPIEDVPEEAKR